MVKDPKKHYKASTLPGVLKIKGALGTCLSAGTDRIGLAGAFVLTPYARHYNTFKNLIRIGRWFSSGKVLM